MLKKILLFSLFVVGFVLLGDSENNNLTSQDSLEDSDIETIELKEDSPQNSEAVDEDSENSDLVSTVDEDAEDFELPQEETEEVDASQLILLDKLEAVVAEGDNFQVIATSDIHKRDFDGQQHNLDEIITENLLDIFATKLKMNVDDTDINKYLQKMHLSKEQIQNIAKAHGMYDISEFYELFKKMYKASNAMNFKIQSELVFSEDVIQQYCSDNPIIEPAVFTISTAFIPFDRSKNIDEQYADILEALKGEKHMDIFWNPPFELKAAEISGNNNFIFEMKEGEVKVQQSKNSFDLYKLIKLKPEREIPAADRRMEVINVLKQQKYEEVVKKIIDGLRASATILTPTFAQYPIPVYVGDISE